MEIGPFNIVSSRITQQLITQSLRFRIRLQIQRSYRMRMGSTFIVPFPFKLVPIPYEPIPGEYMRQIQHRILDDVINDDVILNK